MAEREFAVDAGIEHLRNLVDTYRTWAYAEQARADRFRFDASRLRSRVREITADRERLTDQNAKLMGLVTDLRLLLAHAYDSKELEEYDERMCRLGIKAEELNDEHLRHHA